MVRLPDVERGVAAGHRDRDRRGPSPGGAGIWNWRRYAAGVTPAASTTICCANAIAERGAHVLGAQAGEARLARLAHAAGFSRFRAVMQTPFNLVLEARR